MKRRIIGTVLVVVMLVLSLASCGYSLKDDDMSKYATLSEADKDAFLKALEKITVEDGDFTTDPETRKNKVMDFIYANIMASAADTSVQKTEGVPGSRDKVYYCYYTTAEFDGKTVILETANLKTVASSLMLGASDYDTVILKSIASGLSGLDFKDKVYKSTTSGKAETGKYAYVSCTYTYSVEEEGVKKDKTGEFVNKVFVVGNAPAKDTTATTMEAYLADKTIGTKLEKITLADETLGNVTYSDITINWTSAQVAPSFEFTDVTYTESKTFKDTEGVSRDVKDKLLKYHVFPAYYIETPVYNPTNLIDLYYGEEINADSLYAIILGEEYTNLDEKEDKEKIEERAELVKNYKTADGDSIEAFAEKLVKLYDEIEETETARDDASTAVSEATRTRDEAQTKLDTEKAKETPDAEEVTRLEEALAKAEENLTKTKEANTKASESHESKKLEKDAYIESFLKITTADGESFESFIERRFREETYNALQETYNEEIRMNLAKEVYYFITTYVKLNGTLPEKAVESTYEALMENYENDFYTGMFSDSKSNYKEYGKFEKFLIQQVLTDYEKKVTTFSEAKAAVKEAAQKMVEPLVQIYLMAEVFDLEVTDKEFKEYKKDPESEYSLKEYSYGANSTLHAYQLDKVLDFFLAFEETEAVKDANGYETVTYKYTYGTVGGYVFGTPASETPAEEETSGAE